jgi:hypothetical protein
MLSGYRLTTGASGADGFSSPGHWRYPVTKVVGDPSDVWPLTSALPETAFLKLVANPIPPITKCAEIAHLKASRLESRRFRRLTD